MLKSMTGYGTAKYEINGREYIIEIKSINNRYCDVNIKLPRNIIYLEPIIKKEVLNNISRGKIEVSITFNNNSNIGKKVTINEELVEIYIKQLEKIANKYNIKQDISVTEISKFPDVLEIKSDDEDTIKQEIEIPVKQAIDNLIEMKKTEGRKLTEDIEKRIKNILKNVEQISKLSTGLIEEYIVKLEARVKELIKTELIDKSRLEQEVVLYADKCSVEEEITRLKSHIDQFINLLQDKKYITIGKKLDFIIQEMNRETNTIGSKANCLEITNLVIEIKTELENIREQVQNIE